MPENLYRPGSWMLELDDRAVRLDLRICDHVVVLTNRSEPDAPFRKDGFPVSGRPRSESGGDARIDLFASAELIAWLERVEERIAERCRQHGIAGCLLYTSDAADE